MEHFKYRIFPHVALIVFLFMIGTSVFGIISQNENKALYLKFLILVFTVSILAFLEFDIWQKIEFKRIGKYYLCSCLSWYMGMGIFVFGTKWMGWRMENVIFYTLLFVVFYGFADRWSVKKTKKDAEKINEWLKEL